MYIFPAILWKLMNTSLFSLRLKYLFFIGLTVPCVMWLPSISLCPAGNSRQYGGIITESTVFLLFILFYIPIYSVSEKSICCVCFKRDWSDPSGSIETKHSQWTKVLRRFLKLNTTCLGINRTPFNRSLKSILVLTVTYNNMFQGCNGEVHRPFYTGHRDLHLGIHTT